MKNYGSKVGLSRQCLESIASCTVLSDSFKIYLINEIKEYICAAEKNLELLDSELLYLTNKVAYIMPYSEIKSAIDRNIDMHGCEEVISFYESNKHYKLPGSYILELATTPLVPGLSVLSAIAIVRSHIQDEVESLLKSCISHKFRHVLTNVSEEYKSCGLSSEAVVSLFLNNSNDFNGFNELIQDLIERVEHIDLEGSQAAVQDLGLSTEVTVSGDSSQAQEQA